MTDRTAVLSRFKLVIARMTCPRSNNFAFTPNCPIEVHDRIHSTFGQIDCLNSEKAEPLGGSKSAQDLESDHVEMFVALELRRAKMTRRKRQVCCVKYVRIRLGGGVLRQITRQHILHGQMRISNRQRGTIFRKIHL